MSWVSFELPAALHGIFLISGSTNLNNARRHRRVFLSGGPKSLQEERRKCGTEKFWHISVCWLCWRLERRELYRPAIGTTRGTAAITSGRTCATTIGTSAAITRG